MTHPLIRECWMHLQERFSARVLEQNPQSVLDVGCGSGVLLDRLRDHSISAVGLDPSSQAMEILVEKGLEGVQGEAAELPFEDSSFDWVTMRHVAHHLADVPRAFAEALRVGRCGFLVAEPWFDLSLASQRTAETLDLWGKRQHRHCGQVHDPVLGPREIFAAVPESIRYSASSERYLDWQEIPVEVAREQAATLLDRLDSDAGERRAFEEIAGAIEAHGLTYNGTVICRIAVLDR